MRASPIDYVDTAAALGRYTVAQLIGLARRLDPGLTERDFADAGQQLDRMPDGLFARYGLSPRRRRQAAGTVCWVAPDLIPPSEDLKTARLAGRCGVDLTCLMTGR